MFYALTVFCLSAAGTVNYNIQITKFYANFAFPQIL